MWIKSPTKSNGDFETKFANNVVIVKLLHIIHGHGHEIKLSIKYLEISTVVTGEYFDL